MDDQSHYPSDDAASGPGRDPGQGAHDDTTRPIPSYGARPAPPPGPPYAAPQGRPGTEDTTRYEPMFGGFRDQDGPFAQPGYPTRTEEPRRHRGLTAAVLVGALVLGGGAGVGGAAAYNAFVGDGSSNSGTGSSDTFEATKTSLVKDGTVEKVADAVLPSVVKVNVSGHSESGSGSGIVLSKGGEILTNNHVVSVASGGGSISVSFNDGTTKKATVVGADPLTDVAVIKAAGVSDLTPASLGKSSALKVGQTVVAVGSPYGLNATVTSGIVSALNRPVSVSQEQPQQEDPFGGQSQQSNLSTTYPAIQTDAAINPGNSGGPLVDLSGRVVGINSSIRTSGSSGLSGDSGGSIGLGFAIPIDEVLPIVNQITDGQKPTHARLGVSVSDATASSTSQGAQLRTIESGGSAAGAGLQVGDVITKVDDQIIDGSESLVATIRGHRPEESVQLSYLRGGKTRTTTAKLGSDADTKTS